MSALGRKQTLAATVPSCGQQTCRHTRSWKLRRSCRCTTTANGPASHSRMSIEESERKSRDRESGQRRSERLEQRAEARDADMKVDDANVQRMIERSIKDHGA